jgi:O-antigen/teichoic acid export membrane protein
MSNISLKNNIKEKVIVGMLWSFAERFGFLTIQFITNIILSRILSPIDFGLIGMLMVFIALSNVIIEGGLGSALIQKKKPSSEDYSTIFYINIIIAIFLYVILYLSSNQISNFYKQDLLEDMLKVIGLVLFFDSLSIVQNNLLMKKLNFKKIAKIKVSAALLSSIVAIISAINGLGVWSLVIQTLLNSFFKTVFFWLLANWKPSFVFSYKSFKELFGYGYKLLTASMLSELFQNLQTLIIGRVFSAKDLGFFTQAKT